MGRRITVGLVLVMIFIGVFSTHISFSIAQNVEKGEKAIIWIHNVYDLQNMSKNLSGNYALANDIDATITKNWNNGAGFVPIGNDNAPFNGIFDGRGYKIIGLCINSSASYVGLFGYITGNVKNVSLVNINVTASGYNAEVGGLVGENWGTVSNCYVTGSVSASEYKGITGGLVGINNRRVVNSSVRGRVSATGHSVVAGGLVGANDAGVVSNSYAIVNVSARGKDSIAGGLIGWNHVGDVENSYAIGNVSGDLAGGLLGKNGETVKNSHYDIDRTLINGGHYITIGGMYHAQFQDWLANGKKLNPANYPSLVPDGEYYDISNVQGLKDMLGFAEDGLKFRLTVNIDLSGMPNFYIPYFDGIFDGDNHTVLNLNVSISFVEYSGFFGINRGTVENIGVVNGNVNGQRVGCLIGWNYGNVERSYATGNVRGDWDDVGGLIGYNSGTVSNSYATGNVCGSWYNVGGLVGENFGTISNSYATGNVSGSYNVGGLVGENLEFCMVSNSYAAGNVSGEDYVGGLVGWNRGTVMASFWDVDTSGINHSDGGIGKTTEGMKNKTTFINAGWDFNHTWGIWDGVTYPFLRWQGLKSIASAPTNIQGNVGDGYVNLTWNAPENDGGLTITEYRVYRNGTKIATVPVTQLWFNDTNVVDGQTYTYYVTAVNAAGESPKSDEVQATPEITPGAIIAMVLLSLIIVVLLSLIIIIALRKRKN